ncbi:MAG TPA: CRTAC1 family protein [Vicinamibacterales bacterium]|nr:CRTAC1 family protein [Vicinamibacterales bacterium]
MIPLSSLPAGRACLVVIVSASLTLVAPAAGLPTFGDVTARAGIHFRHNSGAFGKKYLPETLGSGCAFLDVDNDGWPDILLVNSRSWPGHPGPPSYPALYRNNRDGTFTDITRQSGLAVEMYGMGVAVGDYDNDGNVDVFITALDGNHLFHNAGGGKFTDVTKTAGVAAQTFSTSAIWFDYDRDGKLDLFVANYVDWSIEKDLFCTLDGTKKSYCTPESYKGRSPALYHNRGDGTFEDVTKKAGVFDPTSKALGVAMLDYDNDGWPDLIVTNDTQPNRLYRNQRNGTFADVGMTAGVAFDEGGVARAGMGVDAADFDGSGKPGIVIGNFSNQMMTLYANEGNGLFIDEAPTSSIGRATLLSLTFACFFFDADLDGLPDIFAANGHVADDINAVQPKVTYAEPPHLFRNLGARRFEAVSAKVGAAFQQPMVARGAAYADIDNDGDLDLIVTTNNGPARLLRNDGGNRNHMLRVKAVGTTSNRDGIGAKIRVRLENGASQWALVRSGSSYLSQSELTLTFGLGSATAVKAVEITWPDGQIETLPRTAGDQTIVVKQGGGIIRSTPIRRTS